MAQNKKLVFSDVSLTKARPNKYGMTVMSEIKYELEKLLVASGYLENAPFNRIAKILGASPQDFRYTVKSIT